MQEHKIAPRARYVLILSVLQRERARCNMQDACRIDVRSNKMVKHYKHSDSECPNHEIDWDKKRNKVE